MKVRSIGVVLALVMMVAVVSANAAQKAPWWKQQKIRFMWGCWGLAGTDKSVDWVGRAVPREVFRNVALSGATTFADTWIYSAAHARMAKEFGMRYFAPTHLAHMTDKPGGRTWINEDGQEVAKYPGTPGHLHRCPLDEFVYERWLAGDEKVAGMREGIIDGITIDWESTEAGICYCDDCFTKFLESQSSKAGPPEKAKRFSWLKEHNLVEAYEGNFHKRRVAMFTSIRKKLQKVNPNLLFASYNVLQPRLVDFMQAMCTPEKPFIVLDARHYQNDDRKPWWESFGVRLKQDGYIYIPGGWSNSLFGSQPSQVSAARWMYETSINEDGVWMWFEHPLTDDNLRAYAAADRDIRAVQQKVGKFLFNGKSDPNLVTVVEWTGRPELEKAVIHRSYSLGEEHLAHLNNVDADWPLRARVRFPRLADGQRWTVRDPLGDLCYTQDGKSVVWTTAQLRAGVVVAMEARSDLFLHVSPVRGNPRVDPNALIYSREIDDLPEHADAAKQATPISGPTMPVGLYYDAYLGTLLASTKKVLELPNTGWQFKMDQGDAGIAGQWYQPQSPLDGWTPIETGAFWGDKGGTGAGWYRSDVDIPALPTDKRVYLHFGAVDEELMLWIDGKPAGDYKRGPIGWDQPFAIDVTDKLTAGRHHLAMRVYNSAFAGGVWKPTSLLTGPAIQTAGSGRLVYTATEQMPGLEMPSLSGAGTISINAIRTVDGDGSNPNRVRQLQGHLWSPQYSPDGSKIAFVHYARGRGQVYVMNQDGSDAVNISSNKFCDRSPVWSPDGTNIAFVSDREADWDIYVMNADGSNQRRLAGNPGMDRAPAWSPDGKRVAWESHVSGMPNIWVCDADGRNSHSLIDPAKPLKFQSVIQGAPGVFQIDESAGSRPVFADNSMYLWDPVWSPDGKLIAAGALHTMAGDTIALLQSDGSGLVQLIYGIVGVGNVTWSPDGTQLAGTLRTAPQESERSGIFVVKADGTADYRWLVDVTPQGPRLGGVGRVGSITWYSNGSAQPRRVLKSFYSLKWSPDGKALAFSSDMDPTGAFYLYTVPVEGGTPTRLDATLSAWPQEASWTK